jgi:hypothetical protein
MYDELFFASTSECNDPFDGKSFYEFSSDTDSWIRLLQFGLGKQCDQYHKCVSKIAAEFSSSCPLTFDEASSFDFVTLFLRATDNSNWLFATAAANAIQRVFQLYKPPTRYFASFSRVCDEPLMWSHYATRHEGFCLVFRSLEGALRQHPQAIKKSMRRTTPEGIASSMSFHIPERFLFQDVSYVPAVEHLSAFKLFPESVSGPVSSEEERNQIASAQAKQFLQKHHSWSYESESRLMLTTPTPWLFGDRFEYSVQERLFHFEPTQLVGIILGARIREDHKNRLFQILDERIERLARQTSYKRIIFDFLIQEARLSSRHREIKIDPVKMLGLTGPVVPGDAKFNPMYSQWVEGWGIEFDGGSARRVQILD